MVASLGGLRFAIKRIILIGCTGGDFRGASEADSERKLGKNWSGRHLGVNSETYPECSPGLLWKQFCLGKVLYALSPQSSSKYFFRMGSRLDDCLKGVIRFKGIDGLAHLEGSSPVQAICPMFRKFAQSLTPFDRT